jgi:hypothetical protein
MWPVRLLFHAVAVALLAGAFTLSTLVAFDVPGLLASGRIDPSIPNEIRREMGIENWPFVLRSVGGVGVFVLGCLALAFQMWTRRPRGVSHMLRGVLGAVALVAAPFFLARHAIDWGASAERLRNGWEVWQGGAQGLPTDSVVRATALVVGGIVLLLWPARNRTAAADVQAPLGDGGVAVAAGVAK